MAQLIKQADLAEQIIADLQRWYHTDPVPKAFAKADPRVVATAYQIAGHDWRRCTTDDGKAITVWNYPVW